MVSVLISTCYLKYFVIAFSFLDLLQTSTTSRHLIWCRLSALFFTICMSHKYGILYFPSAGIEWRIEIGLFTLVICPLIIRPLSLLNPSLVTPGRFEPHQYVYTNFVLRLAWLLLSLYELVVSSPPATDCFIASSRWSSKSIWSKGSSSITGVR